MSVNLTDKQSMDGAWLMVFVPEARCLMAEEIEMLPVEKRQTVEAGGREGVWLKVPCPDRSCITKDAKLMVPAMGFDVPKEKGLWLRMFCPADRCLIDEATDLP